MAGVVDWRLVIDNQALQGMIRGPAGPVYNDMLRRAQIIQRAAVNQIPMGTSSNTGPRGHLKESVVKRIMTNTQGNTLTEIWVGSEHPRALLHHEGSRAHTIFPSNASVLVFKAYGTTVFAMSVNHPGTKPNRYLTDNLPLARDPQGA